MTDIGTTEEEVVSDLTVSDLTELIKNALRINFDNSLCVIGEISNFKPSKNNVFFTLKDELATINCVIWNYASRKDKTDDIKDGKKVKVYGNLVIFAKSGSYNLNAHKIELLGVGDLHQDYMKTKEHYSKLGYFNEDHKKKLPISLSKVGIITAIDGAALQDFLYVIKKNNFVGEIYIKNCQVQGKECPSSIVSGLKELDKMNLDVIVIARGGGSFEDLYGFSDKTVIEELHNCKTCTVSAIGHEVDFMLSDFAADIRAPTPSIAGEMISSKKEGIYNMDEITDLENKLKNIINTKLSFLEYDIVAVKNLIKSPLELIDKEINDMDTLANKLLNLIRTRINSLDSDLNDIFKLINSNKGSSEGYCIAYTINDKQIGSLNEFNEAVSKKKKLKLKFSDGIVIFDIRNIQLVTNE